MRSVGLDFGTTNSAIGVADESGHVELAKFAHAAGVADTFRSILYFHPELRDKNGRYEAIGGPRAIDRYLEAEGKGRLIQSLKSYLADRSFQATEQLGPLGSRIVVGRPVRFAHADTAEDEALALDRLTTALAKVGWTEVVFELEPVAAAYYYEKQLTQDELVLIADVGGGTSDFSLIDVGPSRKTRVDGGKGAILGTDGVALAGDSLDARILHHVVAPKLGLGATYKAMFGRELDVPVWIYAKLRKWHHLSFLKTKKNMELFEEIASQSDGPTRTKIEDLVHILDNDLGYHLYRSIERAKVALSASEKTQFSFVDSPLAIEAEITRPEFEQWIGEEVKAMEECVDRLLAHTGIPASSVDQVFMTGGTSFVPAVRRIFDERFGREKIRAGGEMISVATGLALRAMEP